MEDLIIHAATLFDGDEQAIPIHSSPPLPPTPLGEVPTHYPYGSKTTKVANISIPPSEDFTPRLPPRPGNSIHPSARAPNQSSPTKDRTDIPPIPQRPTRTSEDTVPPSPSAASTTFETDTAASTDDASDEQDSLHHLSPAITKSPSQSLKPSLPDIEEDDDSRESRH